MEPEFDIMWIDFHKGDHFMPTSYSDDYKAMIVELYNQGTPVQQLSKDYNVAISIVHKWIKARSTKESEKRSPADVDAILQRALRAEQENEI